MQLCMASMFSESHPADVVVLAVGDDAGKFRDSLVPDRFEAAIIERRPWNTDADKGRA